MPLNLASPGIVVREVDLTIGRVDPTSGSTGALVSPFEKGPVGDPQLIESEEDLLQTYGKPYSTDKHYENWLVASSYLAYGGTLSVVRADDQNLKNAAIFNVVGAATSIKIKGREHYQQLGYDESPITNAPIVANSPGTWANGLRVAIIDGKADQAIKGIPTTGLVVGMGVTVAVPLNKTVITTNVSTGATAYLDGHFSGVLTEIVSSDAVSGLSTVAVKLVKHVSDDGTVTDRDYEKNGNYAFPEEGVAEFHTPGQTVGLITASYNGEYDWFESQKLDLNVGAYDWSQVANKPGTSSYVAGRGGRFDEVHVVVIDDEGTVTGNAGTILEKHLNLSKASDAEFSVGSSSYWRKYLEVNSRYIFGGQMPVGVTTTSFGNSPSTFEVDSDNGWNQPAANVNFSSVGNYNNLLEKGYLYGGTADDDSKNIKAADITGAFTSGLDDIISGYTLFDNAEETDVDFILMGSAAYPMAHARALAQKVIAVAEGRQDCVAFVSPYREAFLNETTDGTMPTVNEIDAITENIVKFYSPVTSSSYGVLDSGYKYMYDRFNNTFRYIPLNGDIAGTCARTSLEQFPWFSPAGTARGAILNAVKLVYNPGKKQRDILYSNRVNPVINSPGAGIILFGDKTAFAKSSAFDRINVRRLFIFLEDAISAAAKDQLFEFNDELTRTNFVNIVEPFLRDVQAKRGIFDFVVVCDETNNTAAVIDNNEFVADIFIKPARSINFIGLTFVATRTGVSFEEVIGSV
tara:strand:- start:3 stop:2240 length:2238 start_codon:yes stop_codon:yes gene_type:complete